MKNIAVMGAAGATGRLVVEQGLAKGYRITAFDLPWKAFDLHDARLRVVRGDCRDLPDVEAALKEHSAVISVIGPPLDEHGRDLVQATENLIQAMHGHGVKRLVAVSALGVGETRQHMGFLYNLLLTPALVEGFVEAKQEQERLVMSSDLDWTIVRPGRLTDGPLVGTYHHGHGMEIPSPDPTVSRADLAHFLLRQIEDRTYLHQTPGICY